MGARGPVPKRSSERRRRNVDNQAEKVEAAGEVRIPTLPKGTHKIARAWFRSLQASGQAAYYEPSDWAAAVVVCEQLTRLLAGGKAISGPAFAAVWGAMADLLSTEGSRRRVRMEIERSGAEEETPPGVTAMEDFRRRMGMEA
jgi:hypothetical protein